MPLADMRIIQDKKRLESLHTLHLLDTPPDPAFDRLAELAATVLQVPVALVTLVDAERQYFKSQIGLPEPWSTSRETPLSHSVCQHVVATAPQPLVIDDTRVHPLVYDNLAIPDMNVIAYLGIPIVTSMGQAIGSFAAIDHQPREWKQSDIDILTKLAASAMTEIELRAEIGERLRIEQIAHEKEHFSNQIINNTPGLIYVYDLHEQSLIYVSKGAEAIYGMSVEHLKSLSPAESLSLVHPDDYPVLRERRMQLLSAETEGPISFDYRVCPPGKDHVWLRSSESIFSYDDDAGQPTEVIGVAQIITEYKKTEQEREELLVRITELEQVKSDMLRVAAHDLRAPLTLIVGYAGLLRDDREGLTQEQYEYIAEISKSAARMERMIRDILSLERIEAHAAGQHDSINLNDLVQIAFHTLRPYAEQKSLNYTLTVPDEPIVVQGDLVQLQEAFENLIGNAIKYTPDEGTIQVRLMENGVFEVEDNGYGIPDEQQKGLFSPFFRVQNDETRDIEGTGLGLHLVKRIIERHGGRMHFHSKHGQGSIFGFQLGLTE